MYIRVFIQIDHSNYHHRLGAEGDRSQMDDFFFLKFYSSKYISTNRLCALIASFSHSFSHFAYIYILFLSFLHWPELSIA